MPIPLLLVITVFACLAVSIVRKHISGTFPSNPAARQLFIAINSFIAMIVLFIMGGFGETSLYTILLALLFGAVTAIQQSANIKAYELGPLSYTTVIVSLSTLIPALSGVLFWEEDITILQIIGMIFMVICIILSVNSSGSDKKASFKWLLYCSISFVLCGSIGVMQKIHQYSDHKDELNSFLIIAFGFSVIFAIVTAIVFTHKQKKQSEERPELAPSEWSKKFFSPLLILLIILAGAGAAVNNKLNLYLSGIIPSAIFFPVINGAGLVLAAISGIIIFKEKLTLKQWIGFFAGIISVILLVL